MINKLITTTGLTLLVVCSTAMCANYKIANGTGGILSISPEICYGSSPNPGALLTTA